MADNKKTALLVVGGIGAVALVGFAIAGGQSSSTGASYAAPDPQSVAAVESNALSEAELTAQEASSRMTTAANLALGLAGLQQQINLAQIEAGTTEYGDAQTTNQVGLQTSGAVNENAVDAQFAAQKAQLDDAASEAVATSVANANTAIATITGNANEAIASTQAGAAENVAGQSANAAEQISTNQTNAQENAANQAANASNTASTNNLIGNIAGGILGLFGL